MQLSDNIQYLKGVGKKKAQLFQRLNIETIYDLLSYYPKAYTDQSEITAIENLTAGTVANVSGTICGLQERTTRTRLTMLTAFIDDGTGIIAATWFNKKFLKKQLKQGAKIFLHGKIEYAYGGHGRFCIKNITSMELETEQAPASFVPIYPLVEGLKANFLRTLIADTFDQFETIPSAFPAALQKAEQLLPKKAAMYALHFPQNSQELSQARHTLIFEELFLLQYGLQFFKQNEIDERQYIQYRTNQQLVEKVEKSLPFTLTPDQKKVWQEICQDMQAPRIMQRLLQGDVGSGKTVIALLALIKAVENGYQGAFMAPTEILAQQHFESFQQLLAPFQLKLGILTGSLSAKEHQNILTDLASGSCQIVIGTHALIQEKVSFHNLGLVITDEQHRFGIAQRSQLEEKSHVSPDTLIMTATPIPRTMTLTFYGDLNVSTIHHLPPGRKPIRTFLRGKESREKIYAFIVNEIKKGRQAYVVCPLIALSDNLKTVSAEEIYEELTNGILRDINCALIHGKLPAKEKEAIMQDFAANKISLLISTTVIEVGVNVPNASVMVIEGAERFGLAQLHQLRGRIGRGSAQSYCILVAYNKNDNSQQRLELMEKISDGFQLAEADLKLRGPGQFFGAQQHGLPDLKIANLLEDLTLLQKARDYAASYLQNNLNPAPIKQVLSLQYKSAFTNILRN